jgi:hypothetical protein
VRLFFLSERCVQTRHYVTFIHNLICLSDFTDCCAIKMKPLNGFGSLPSWLILAIVPAWTLASPTSMPSSIVVKSASTCEDLGWDNAMTYGSSLVCGESELPNDLKCQGYRTWLQAHNLCMSIGARLCTASELEDDETKGHLSPHHHSNEINQYRSDPNIFGLYYDYFYYILRNSIFTQVQDVVSTHSCYGAVLLVMLAIWLHMVLVLQVLDHIAC